MAGFVSEWMVLESLFQSYQFTSNPILIFVGLLGGAAVALAAGLIVVAMVKVLAFGQLWRPDASHPSKRARRLGAAVLGIGTVVVALGVLAPWILELAATPAGAFAGYAVAAPVSLTSNLAIPAGWSILSGHPFGILSPPALPIALGVGALVGVAYLALGGIGKSRRTDPWMAGNRVRAPDETYSAFGYSTGLRIMLSSLFLTREVRSQVGPVTVASIASPESYDVELEVLDVFKIFYDGLERGVVILSDGAKRVIMPGRVGQYIAYLLVAAIFVILYVVAVL
jgi:hydrogenase-4 component B